MGEREREGGSSCCECDFCGADIKVAFYLEQGDLVYCQECLEAYIVVNRYPVRLLPQAKRQLQNPWQDGFAFT